LVAVMAFAGTAALAVTLTGARVSERATLSSETALNTCAAPGLHAQVAPASGGVRAAGGKVYALEFTNVSAHPCHLYGYPEVSAYAGSPAAGVPIGAAATHDTSVRPRPVVLAPGATARSVLRVTSVSGLPRTACGQVTARVLRVVLPESRRPAFVPVRLPACSKRGHAFMSVLPIQARAGVHGSATP
jgi:hypothetical protein